MTPALCAAVCTYNRSSAAIEAVETLLASGDGIPVVIVDSGSSVEHARALERFAGLHDDVRLERCDVPGVAVARNRAVTAAGSDWVAFVDDDVAVAHDWWSTASRIVRAAEEDVAVIGGRILPRWPGRPPEHVGWRWLMFLSCIEDLQQRPSSGIPECYNGNLLLRASAWQAVGGYPEDLGRVGDVLLSGEENELQQRLATSGWRVVYDGSLVAHHIIDAERLTRPWIRSRAYWGGVSEVIGTHARGASGKNLRPARAAVAFVVLRLVALVEDDRSDRFIRAHYARGVLAGRRRARRFVTGHR